MQRRRLENGTVLIIDGIWQVSVEKGNRWEGDQRFDLSILSGRAEAYPMFLQGAMARLIFTNEEGRRIKRKDGGGPFFMRFLDDFVYAPNVNDVDFAAYGFKRRPHIDIYTKEA
jgi:hypothetical protein